MTKSTKREYYYKEISTDGGKTWITVSPYVWKAEDTPNSSECGECNEWSIEWVNLDSTPYQSSFGLNINGTSCCYPTHPGVNIDYLDCYYSGDTQLISCDHFFNRFHVYSIDLSDLCTKNVKDFNYFFSDLSVVESLDVSSLVTSKVELMQYTFQNIKSNIIGLENWDTKNVKSMLGLFKGCTGLTTIDLSTWETPLLTNINQMFYNCSGLTTINLSTWDTSSLKYCHELFYGCSSLIEINLSNWDFLNVGTPSAMFYGCDSLETIYMRNCSQDSISKIKTALDNSGISGVQIITT